MARRSLAGARILLTGATSGIGRAMALELARRGSKLLLSGRRDDRLQDVAAQVRRLGNQVLTETGDLVDPTVRRGALRQCQEHWGGLDVLINNAGIGAQGPFADAQPERLRRILEVNLIAPLELTREVLPTLLQGRQPLVACVGSVLSHFAVADKSEYCASKFALRGFCNALRQELRPSGVDVVLICPSTTRTEFFERALDSDKHPPGPYRFGAMTAEKVAHYAVRAIERGQRELLLTTTARLILWLDRLLPSLADAVLLRFAK